MKSEHNLGAVKARILDYIILLDVSPLESRMRCVACNLASELAMISWPERSERTVINALHKELFVVTHEAGLGAGPLRETARRIRQLIELLIPNEEINLSPNSAVLTPEEAARYLGLDRLGVTNPANRIRYLVKKKRLRPTRILGRLAFQRSDLDNYLISHTR